MHRRTAVSHPLPRCAVAAPALPRAATDADPENTIYLDLKQGRVVIQLLPEVAPKTVAQIKTLARQGFYDGTPFHRVIEGFMAQGGDPTGTGTGGSKLPDLPLEASQRHFVRGVCGMARSLRSGQRQQPVLHHVRAGAVAGRTIHDLGPGRERHGVCGPDQARRAGSTGSVDRPGSHRAYARGRGREVAYARTDDRYVT